MTKKIYDVQPLWLKDHPSDLIFNYFENNVRRGRVWFRPIDQGFEIDYLEIFTEFRNQGFGVKMLLSFIDYCKGQSEQVSIEVWLEVSELNEVAIHLYKQVGFEVVGIRPNYYPDGSSAWLMTKR